MSTTIDVARVQNFSSNITLLFQQKASKLRASVGQVKPVIGKLVHFDRLASTNVTKRVTRNQPTALTDNTHTRRAAAPSFYDGAWPVDPMDLDRILIDPKSNYTEIAAYAMARALDLDIYTQTRGSALVGENGTDTPVALPSGQKIAHGSAGMTLAKILQAHRMLNGAEVPSDGRFAWIDSFALEDMLNIQQLTSSDYNSVKMLTTGELNSFMGFNWSMYNYAAESSVYYAVFGHRSSLGLAIPKELSTQVDKRPDLSNIWQVYVSADFGSVRIVDEGIVECAYQ
jgi:P22 coat protein - gene protein 5.